MTPLSIIPNSFKDKVKSILGLKFILWEPSVFIESLRIDVKKFNREFTFISKGDNPLWHTIFETFDYDCYFFDQICGELSEALFIDVGANVGVISILASSLGADVIAIEPDPQNISLLNENSFLNNQKISIIDQPLGIKSDQILRFSMNSSVGNSVVFEDLSSSHIDLKSISLGDILKSVKAVNKKRILKMDIEGLEHEIFASPDFDLKFFDFYLIEVHDISRGIGLNSFIKLFNKKDFNISIKKDAFGRKFLNTIMIIKIN